MTEAERKAQWQDPYIRELLEELRTCILNRYLHLDKRRKLNSLPAGRIQDKRVSATG